MPPPSTVPPPSTIPPNGVVVEAVARLDPATRAAVRALAAAEQERVGEPPLSDQALAQLDSHDVLHLTAHADAALVGYAQLHQGALELVGEPTAHADLLAHAERAASSLEVWSHGQASPLVDVLQGRGYRPVRALHQLRRDTAAVPPAPLAPLAPGVTVRTFQVGRDEQEWLRVNHAAFASHPEQGRWTLRDLSAREAESWFDPAGFFVAERDGVMVAFHWTKVHPDGAGEVYVLGVDPGVQGLGLGQALLSTGLRHLVDRGCPTVLLYVDDDNTGARRLYERAGFVTHDIDTLWRRTNPPDTP